MNRNTKATILFVIYSLLLLPHLWAAPIANPAWYDIEYTELTPPGTNLYDNSLNVWKMNLDNINFAMILTGLEMSPPSGYEHVYIRFDAPGNIFRFVKMDDPNKHMDATIRLQHEGLPLESVFPGEEYPIIAGAVGNEPTETNLFMDIITLPPNSGVWWRGTYYLPLEIQVCDIDGYVLAEKTLQMMVYFRDKDDPVIPHTNISVERYPVASQVPVPYPYQPGIPVIEVGAIHFQSNEEYNKYRLRISPLDHTKFQFNHTNPNAGGTIMYGVTIPGRTVVSYEESFNFNFDYKGNIGNWYDSLVVGVRDVNYNNSNGPTGAYTSSIRIELVAY